MEIGPVDGFHRDNLEIALMVPSGQQQVPALGGNGGAHLVQLGLGAGLEGQYPGR